jgi:hypothetical protein
MVNTACGRALKLAKMSRGDSIGREPFDTHLRPRDIHLGQQEKDNPLIGERALGRGIVKVVASVRVSSCAGTPRAATNDPAERTFQLSMLPVAGAARTPLRARPGRFAKRETSRLDEHANVSPDRLSNTRELVADDPFGPTART